MLRRLRIAAPKVRLPAQLDEIDGLIIPRGESATVVQLIDIYGSCGSLWQMVRQDMAIWVNCAWMPACECLRGDACTGMPAMG